MLFEREEETQPLKRPEFLLLLFCFFLMLFFKGRERSPLFTGGRGREMLPQKEEESYVEMEVEEGTENIMNDVQVTSSFSSVSVCCVMLLEVLPCFLCVSRCPSLFSLVRFLLVFYVSASSSLPRSDVREGEKRRRAGRCILLSSIEGIEGRS